MKLSKLKKIIKESLNSLNEQQGFPNPKLCRIEDFKATGQCAQDHFFNSPMGGIGGLTSFDSWLSNQWNAYQGNPGCNQFPAIESWIGSQITPTATCPALPAMSAYGPYGGGPNQAGNCHSLISVKRKFAKMKWANCMTQKCCKEENTDPCKQFYAASQQLQTGCCGKCLNGVYSGIPGDQCDTLTNSCKCCDDDRGGEDVRGCLNPAQSGALNIGMPCPGSVGVVTLHYEPCCEYDTRGGDPCKTFYALPQAQQDGCCEKCQGNISPSDPCYQYCKCCDPRLGEDPCKTNPNPQCYWCNNETGPSCVPVGANLAYAVGNGFTLYQNAADCNTAEPGCRPDDRDPQMIECHKCSPQGYPVGNMFPGPTCPQGWTPVAQFNPADCKPRGGGPTDPSDPVDMVDPGMQRMRDLMEYKKPK